MDARDTPQVLFVEDEGLIRLVTAQMLRDEGFTVIEARNGDEALLLLDTEDGFDVLLTDVQMPGMHDGIAVAEAARALKPNLPILVVSGYAPQVINRLSNLPGPAAHFLSKPYDIDEVIATLKRLAVG